MIEQKSRTLHDRRRDPEMYTLVEIHLVRRGEGEGVSPWIDETLRVEGVPSEGKLGVWCNTESGTKSESIVKY